MLMALGPKDQNVGVILLDKATSIDRKGLCALCCHASHHYNYNTSSFQAAVVVAIQTLMSVTD